MTSHHWSHFYTHQLSTLPPRRRELHVFLDFHWLYIFNPKVDDRARFSVLLLNTLVRRGRKVSYLFISNSNILEFLRLSAVFACADTSILEIFPIGPTTTLEHNSTSCLKWVSRFTHWHLVQVCLYRSSSQKSERQRSKIKKKKRSTFPINSAVFFFGFGFVWRGVSRSIRRHHWIDESFLLCCIDVYSLCWEFVSIYYWWMAFRIRSRDKVAGLRGTRQPWSPRLRPVWRLWTLAGWKKGSDQIMANKTRQIWLDDDERRETGLLLTKRLVYRVYL